MEVEGTEVVVDAVVDAVDVVVAGDKYNFTPDQWPIVHGPLFVNCVGCPPAIDRYKFRVIL